VEFFRSVLSLHQNSAASKFSESAEGKLQLEIRRPLSVTTHLTYSINIWIKNSIFEGKESNEKISESKEKIAVILESEN